MDIGFNLKEEISRMAHITNKNFNIFKDKLKNCLLNYSKEEIIKWVTASLTIPKNQIFSYRFLSIQQIALSLPKEQFKNEKLDEKKMEEILRLTKDLNWDFVEDWIPWNEFEFNFEGKLYKLLPGSLENPLKILDIIIRRILPLDALLKEKIGYSIKEELVKILNFEDKISSSLPDKSLEKGVPWVITSKESIDNIFSVCSEYSPSKQLFKSKEKFEEPKDPAEADSLFYNYPMYNGLLINIPNLLHLFYRKLLEDIKKNTTKELEEELDKQSVWEIVRALTEIMPEEAIISNFQIEGSDQVFDKGFQYENKFFMFNVVKEHLESEKILEEIKSIQKKSKEVLGLFNKSEINLNLNGEKIKLDSKTKPFQIILYDGLNGSKISAINKEILVLDYYSLNYLFEDLFDNQSNPIYLAKVINKFKEMDIIPSPYTSFLDFYDSTKYSYHLFALFKSAIILLDPHMHSTTMEKRQKKRPMWHNQPKAYPQIGSFKIIWEGEHSLYGYNRVLLEDFIYFDKLNLYICKRVRGLDEKSYMISFMISRIVQFYFEELLKKDLIPSIKSQEKVINISPFDDLSEDLRKEHKGKSIEVLSDGNKIFLFFNKDKFFEEFVSDSTSLACFFETRLLGNIFGPKKFKKIEKTLLKIDLKKHFQMGQYASTQDPKNLGNLNFPDNLDFVDTELLLLKELEKKKIVSGVYSADKARPILIDLYSKLDSIISKELSLLDPSSLSKYIYNEIEKTLGIKENIFNSYKLSKGTSNEKTYSERLISEEMKTSRYCTSSRFLLEKLVAQGSGGKERIDIEKWQKLSSLVMKIMNISSILEYLRKPLYDFIKIKLEIDIEKKVFFNIIIEDNPIEKHLSKVVERIGKLEEKNLEIKNNSIESIYSGFDKIGDVGEGRFRKINDLMEKYFGFRCEDYLLVLNILTNYPTIREIGGVCESKKAEVISFISNFLDKKEGGNLLKRDKISKILDFSTIFLQKKISKILPSQGTMQDNRLMVKPLASVGGKLIFGPGMIKAASENFLNSIINGKWVYSNMERLPRELYNSLSDKHSEISKRLEKDLLDQLKKITPYCEGNIAEFKGGKNYKCFAEIEEESPGEIDTLSLHPTNKKIIIWEAKEVSRKFGAREIANLIIDKFIKEEKGYVEKVLKKQKFVEKNIMKVLDYYKIEDTTGWKVDYTFVFYSRNLLMSFLGEKVNFITLDEVKEFVER